METLRLLLQYLITPAIIAVALGWTVQKVIERWIAGSLERYKIQLQTDLESHKAKLKAEYDLRHFEFQQRFSLLHQKQAEVTEKLFESLAEFYNLLQELAGWEALENPEQLQGLPQRNKQEFYIRIRNHLKELGDFYDKKRIYLDDEIQKGTLQVIKTGWFILHSDVFNEMMRVPLKNLMDSEVIPLMEELVKKFKAFLTSTGKPEELATQTQPLLTRTTKH